ncbi:MAG: hypothetical protein IPG80_10460 [Anaerolineales bacterium]|uniref:hypothetical protein n=1 Tax=Candidatus Villigracilis vicinus TaxID=3140679 RepID=UPI00313698A7|nr:hypothetical protein [Anaerolineales bacterium]
MPAHHYELATQHDDPELRRLLRENPFAGSISLSLEREPNYFLASATEGTFHETLVVRDTKTNQLVGIGDRSVRPLYVNGEIKDIGYFSGLRVDSKYQHGLALARFLGKGWEGQREQHKDGRTKFYLMSIVSDNNPAQRLLDSKLPHYPRLHRHTHMCTYAIHPARPKKESKIKITRAASESIPAILDCLHRNGMRHQFAPHWTEETLLSPLTPGLSISNFFLAQSGSRIRGCLALWDQQACKQTVVRGYSGNMARFRKVINLFTPLPEPGTRLNQCFACFLAVDDDDPEVFSALLRTLHNEAARLRYDYFLLGLTKDSPFHSIVKTYRPITYESDIYLAAWEDGFDDIARVVNRPSAPEIALL